MDIQFDMAENPQPFFVPTRKNFFVRAIGGENLHVWLCQNGIRGNQLVAEMLALHDPFVNHFGEPTAVKAWTGYGNPPHNPYED